jgi:hypothetical protein
MFPLSLLCASVATLNSKSSSKRWSDLLKLKWMPVQRTQEIKFLLRSAYTVCRNRTSILKSIVQLSNFIRILSILSRITHLTMSFSRRHYKIWTKYGTRYLSQKVSISLAMAILIWWFSAWKILTKMWC